jgi:IS66 C-terminal element
MVNKQIEFTLACQRVKNWAITASLLETCKLNGVDPLAWLTDVARKLVNRWPAFRTNELLPWSYVKKTA